MSEATAGGGKASARLVARPIAREIGRRTLANLTRPRRLLAALASAAALALACGQTPDAPAPAPAPRSELVVYSGRSESLVAPLFARLEESLGVTIQVRYGGTAELAATLLEEGGSSPADLFLSQDAAALGALSAAGLLRELPADLLSMVPLAFRSRAGDWVGLSGRARAVVFNTERIAPAELPQSLEEVSAPRYRGRFGVAPTNGSFQAHLAVYRAVAGRQALERLLAGMVANRPARYPKNSAIVEAVIAGEVDWGLVNHYYLLRALDERPGSPAANFFMSEGEVSSFVNLSGVGLLRSSPAALALVAALLEVPAQAYFAGETFEYPLAGELPPPPGLPSLTRLQARQLPFDEVAAVLEETLELIAVSGLLD